MTRLTVIPSGPLKRVWVNKNHLPQFGGSSPFAPVWYVECEGVRSSGFRVVVMGEAYAVYEPSDGDGPHAWIETFGEVTIHTAAEEAA